MTVKEFIRDILSCLTAPNAIFGYLPEIVFVVGSGNRNVPGTRYNSEKAGTPSTSTSATGHRYLWSTVLVYF